jgi:hypothetical protein
MKDLILPLKAEYFHQIRSGEKTEEFRLCTPYWRKRLEGRTYRNVILTLGYPKKDDAERRHVVTWKGFVERIIQHKHFGAEPVLVFAIDVSGE